MAKITVDGVEYEVNAENNLLQECLSQGLDLPYFCWHPCMGSIGACRQCAVKQFKDADDERGMIVMACMTPAAEGSIISIKDEQAVQMRERVIESLMISHPHDCPVCEEGGECHLQDMTLMSGHNYRRYDKKKVTHRNQYLGPFINHEMNRCIACYRCVRFYDDYAGGTDLAAMASHHHVYFGRHQEGTLENEFSGNLVEVCPTGVFTDRVFSEHYSRKWDLQCAPSVCTGCATGCNTTPGERYGTLRRIVNRYNSEINGYFICDRGRFGFEYVNSDSRLKDLTRQTENYSEPMTEGDVSAKLKRIKGEKVIGIGSPRASNEANFALRRFVGEENFYAGVADGEQKINQLILQLNRDSAFHNPSVREIELADAILVLGEDITNVAPRIALALRQSVRNKARDLAAANNIPDWQDAAVRELAQHQRSPLALFSSYATRLDDVASEVLIDGPSGLIRQAHALASLLADPNSITDDSADPEQQRLARIATDLHKAKRPLIIAGSSYGQIGLVEAAANIARTLKQQRGQSIDLCLLLPEVNSMGLSLMARPENSLGAALARIESGQVQHAVVVENDLYRRAAGSTLEAAFKKLENLVVLDQLPTATTAKATMLLPVTAFSEHEATYVNYEGRAQISFQVHRNHGAARPSWRWLCQDEFAHIDDLIEACTSEAAEFDHLREVLPELPQLVAGMKIPRQSHRYSGRTAMKANINVHEPKQAVDDESIMAFSMEGISPLRDSTVLGTSWAPGWNSNQSISKFQDEVNGHLKQGHAGELLLQRNLEADFLPTRFPESAGEGLELAPAYQIFGSEELSAHAPAVRERMTDAYLALAPEDAARFELKQGDRVALNGSGKTAVACIRSRIKPGTAALYCGDSGMSMQGFGQRIQPRRLEGAPERGIRGLIVSDLYQERE